MKQPFLLNHANGCHSLARPEPNQLPSLTLPVYLRGTGFFSFSRPRTESVPAGVKNFVQLFWGVQGKGEFLINGTPCDFGEDDIVIRLPLESHEMRSRELPWSYRWVAFDGARAEEFALAYGYPRTVFHSEKCPHDLFLRLEQNLRDRSPFAWREAVGTISLILARAGGRHDNSTKEGRLINRFLELCRDNIGNQSVNINVLSDLLGIDRSTLRRIFEREMLMPPGKYLMQLRIQQALAMLQNTELPVSEIALQCGFSDFSHFCKTIRTATGLSPGRFRSNKTSR